MLQIQKTLKPEILTITGMRHAAHTAFREENNVLTLVYRTATTLQYSSNEYHKDHHKYYERHQAHKSQEGQLWPVWSHRRFPLSLCFTLILCLARIPRFSRSSDFRAVRQWTRKIRRRWWNAVFVNPIVESWVNKHLSFMNIHRKPVFVSSFSHNVGWCGFPSELFLFLLNMHFRSIDAPETMFH